MHGERQMFATNQATGRNDAVGLRFAEDGGERVAADRIDRAGPACG